MGLFGFAAFSLAGSRIFARSCGSMMGGFALASPLLEASRIFARSCGSVMGLFAPTASSFSHLSACFFHPLSLASPHFLSVGFPRQNCEAA